MCNAGRNKEMGLPVEQPCGSEWLFVPLPEFCSAPAADVKGQGPLRDSQLSGLHWSRGWLELLKSPEQHLVSASLFFFFFSLPGPVCSGFPFLLLMKSVSYYLTCIY